MTCGFPAIFRALWLSPESARSGTPLVCSFSSRSFCNASGSRFRLGALLRMMQAPGSFAIATNSASSVI
jgi:hypothetical protein